MEVTPLTPEEIILLAESSDGKGTKSQNNWAANRWKTWAAARNEQFKAGGIRMLEDLKKVPLDNIEEAMTKFVTEIKDTEGLPYEWKTFHTLVMAANRVCVAAHGEEGNFMGKRVEFSFLKKIINGRMKELQSNRKRKASKKSAIVTPQQENDLWRLAFDLSDPRGLLRATVFILHKTFILRGGSELSDLSIADISMQMVELEDDLVEFTYIKKQPTSNTVGEQGSKDC